MKIWLSWSSGKDSAWALDRLRREEEHEVVGLLTSYNERFDRVAVHGVRRDLLRAQARATGLPRVEVPLPWPCSNEDYEERMAVAHNRALEEGVEAIAYGDLFLEDVRAYRECQLLGTGLAPLFPLWGGDTRRLARRMVAAGLEGYLVCIDPKHLPRELAGRKYDGDLLAALPASVDPCGERGEFHTCVTAGPMFSAPIPVVPGESVERDGFVFTDLSVGETTVPPGR